MPRNTDSAAGHNGSSLQVLVMFSGSVDPLDPVVYPIAKRPFSVVQVILKHKTDVNAGIYDGRPLLHSKL
jgi:hypothetical protein